MALKEQATVPAIDPDYLIDVAHLKAIRVVINLADEGVPQNIGLWGAVGSGKTTLARQIGAIRHSPTFVFNAGGDQLDYCIATGFDRDTGASTYRPSRLVEAIETESAVVVVDDLQLQSHTAALLLPVLDPTRRQRHVDRLGRVVRVARGVIIVGTWNPADNPSRTALSEQILDRFRAGAILRLGL